MKSTADRRALGAGRRDARPRRRHRRHRRSDRRASRRRRRDARRRRRQRRQDREARLGCRRAGAGQRRRRPHGRHGRDSPLSRAAGRRGVTGTAARRKRRPVADERASGGGGIAGFVAGLAVGALAGVVLAMILAPQSGEDTRDLLVAKAREAGERARDTAGDAERSSGPRPSNRCGCESPDRRSDRGRQGRRDAPAQHPRERKQRKRKLGDTVDIKVNVRESEGDAYVVDLTGEIDVYTSPKVKDAITELIDQEHYNLVINLEKVRYIDSTGSGRPHRRPQARARARRFGQPRLHESADQEDLRHHRPGEDLRDLRRRAERDEGAGVNASRTPSKCPRTARSS